MMTIVLSVLLSFVVCLILSHMNFVLSILFKWWPLLLSEIITWITYVFPTLGLPWFRSSIWSSLVDKHEMCMGGLLRATLALLPKATPYLKWRCGPMWPLSMEKNATVWVKSDDECPHMNKVSSYALLLDNKWWSLLLIHVQIPDV
jgi:hypothetical protein